MRQYAVEGTTFAPRGQITSADGKNASLELLAGPLQRLAEISALCNDAKVVYDEVRNRALVCRLCNLTLFH